MRGRTSSRANSDVDELRKVSQAIAADSVEPHRNEQNLDLVRPPAPEPEPEPEPEPPSPDEQTPALETGKTTHRVQLARKKRTTAKSRPVYTVNGE